LTCLTADQPDLELSIHSLQVQRIWMQTLLSALYAAYLRCGYTLLQLIYFSQVLAENFVHILKPQYLGLDSTVVLHKI